MDQKADADALQIGDEDDEDGEGEGQAPTNFRDLLGPDCVIRRVDKDKKFLSNTQPEEMQAELMARAGSQKRLGACAEHVKNMDRDQKLHWAIGLKDEANRFYQNLNFEEAARLYSDCLVALDFEGDAQSTKEVREKLQLPVCTNLAACTIEMGKYERCIEICDIALEVDPKCPKALYRRGLAHYRLGDHMSARPDFEAALSEGKRAQEEMQYGEEPRALDDVIRRVTVYLLNIRSYSQAERERCKKMWDTDLYADRQGAKTDAQRQADEDAKTFSVDDSDEAIEEALSLARGDWRCLRCCWSRRSHTSKADLPEPKDKNI